MNILLTNKDGVSMCGTDGAFYVDGRLSPQNVAVKIDEYRQRFKKHFPHKFEYWTHFGIVPNFRNDPSKVYRII